MPATVEVVELTARELEVLQAAADGETIAEMAGRLWLAVSTVKWYRVRVLGKLGARTMPQAVAVGWRWGLIE